MRTDNYVAIPARFATQCSKALNAIGVNVSADELAENAYWLTTDNIAHPRLRLAGKLVVADALEETGSEYYADRARKWRTLIANEMVASELIAAANASGGPSGQD